MKNELETTGKVALLFDLDGTMVDTDHLHHAAYNKLLKPFGRDVSVEYYKTRIMGFPNDEIMAGLFPNSSKQEHLEFANKKELLFREQLEQLTPISGLLSLLSWAEAGGHSVAVVTNAPRQNAMMLLSGLGLASRFNNIVIGEELPHGKPHPLPYLTALEMTGVAPERAFAFEDSLSGVRAASSAGIKTFGMLTSLPEEMLRGAGAFCVCENFECKKMRGHIEAVVTVSESRS